MDPQNPPQPTQTPPFPPSAPLPIEQPSKKKWLLIFGIIILVLFVGLGGYILGTGKNPKPTPTPKPGCFYQQVTCITNPCPPILMCPTTTPPPAGGPTIDATTNWKIYTNIFGYTIKYPENFILGSETFQNPKIETSPGVVIQQKQDQQNTPLLKIYIVDPKNPSIPDKFSSLKELADISYKNNMKSTGLSTKSITEPHETIFNGEKAYEFIIKSKGFELAWSGFLGQEGIIKAVIFQHKDRFFLIGYYDTSEFNQILSTFKFTDSNQSIDTTNWKTYIGETSYTFDGSSKFSIKYPPTWQSEKGSNSCCATLYPEGKGTDLGLTPRIILGAGGHGMPKPTEEKLFPAGKATYWRIENMDGTLALVASFSKGDISYIFEGQSLLPKHEELFLEMMRTLHIETGDTQ